MIVCCGDGLHEFDLCVMIQVCRLRATSKVGGITIFMGT